MGIAKLYNFLSINMAILVFFNSLAMPLIYVDYLARKDFITKVFCINKDKPKLQCNGKCHLKKQVKKSQNDTPEKGQTTTHKFGLELFFSYERSFLLSTLIPTKKQSFYSFNETALNSFTFSIFHPPQTSAFI